MSEERYDLAFSFAGEQRDYVARTVAACKALGLAVFYNKDKNNDWWGGNFIREQRTIYSSRTQYFVPFISVEYLAKPVPMDEFSAAMMTAVQRGDEYILPVLIGEVVVPPDLLHPTVHYFKASNYNPEELAKELFDKVSKSKRDGRPSADLGTVVQDALKVRLPKVVPSHWSKYEELDRTFEYLADSFEAAGPQLRPQGFICTVRRTDAKIAVRVERNGKTLTSIDIEKGKQLGDDKITWGVGHHRGLSGGFNGWAVPKYDKIRGMSVVEVNDFANVGQQLEAGITNNELFNHLWAKIVADIESR